MKKNNGFTLVEMAVVLMIIGLVVGGILTGQSLIHASSLRSLGTDIEKYQVAINVFKDKYTALPGDMSNATDYWGAADGAGNGNSAGCRTIAATGEATCNGDGDGSVERENSIDPFVINSVTGLESSNEWFRAWHHLKNAGLVAGSFTGVANTGAANLAVPNQNVPPTDVGNSGVTFLSFENRLTETGSWFIGDFRLIFSVGSQAGNAETRAGFITPEDALSIDAKIDDGFPGRGKLHGTRSAGGCTTTDVTATALYNIANTQVNCALRYILK
jgi:prepilin-type N-terminal cleavage/methylation domain-containing protein